jgi:antitoxin YefM
MNRRLPGDRIESPLRAFFFVCFVRSVVQKKVDFASCSYGDIMPKVREGTWRTQRIVDLKRSPKSMYTTYRLNANELDERFIQSLKALFEGRDIEITVSEVDETAYLFQSEANREKLLNAVENVAKGENLIEVQIGDLQ